MKVSELLEKRTAELEARKTELAERAEALEEVEELEKVKEELRSVINEIEEIKNAEPEEPETRETEPEAETRDITPEERNFKPLATYGIASEERKDNNNMELEYRSAYLKNLMGKATPEERALVTESNAAIPVEVANKIYGKLSENRLINELAPTRFRGYVSIPVATTVNDASWLPMANDATAQADVVSQIALGAKKLIKLVQIPADMEYLSVDAFEEWLVNALVSKMRSAICNAVIRGAGDNMAHGVLATGSGVPTAGTDVTYEDILNAMANVGGAYHDGAVWVMSSASFFNKVMALTDANKRPLVYQGVEGIEGTPAYMLLGHRVILDENASITTEDDVIFGNFKEGYAFNFASNIEIKRDESTGFANGSVAYRAMALCDGEVADAKAFAVLKVTKG